VLGRAFGAHGEVKQSKDQSLPWLNQSASPNESSGKDSRQAIIQKIVDLFYSDNRKEVSLAESVIRLLISRLSKDKGSYVAEMTKIIPMAIGEALNFPVPAESEDNFVQNSKTLEHTAMPQEKIPVSRWITDLTVALCATASEEPILGSLTKLLLGMEQMAETLFPYILHLVLLTEFEGQRTVRDTLSEAIMSWCSICDLTTTPHVRILIQAILYLRSQPAPKEVTRVDRDRWLEIDYLQASQAATVCGMHRSALLFAETSSGQPIVKTASRRSSVFVDPPRIPVDLQLSIYKNLDEPDSFYGVERGSSLSSVLDRLEYESDGIKSLLFRGARLDSQFRRSNAMDTADSRGMVKSLITLNMNSVTHSLLSNDHFRDIGDDVIESTLHTARKLGQWDIKAPEGNHSEASTLFKAFQSLHHATDTIAAREQVDRQLLATMSSLAGRDRSAASTHTLLRTLAVLTEADEVISAPHPDRLLDIWDQMKARERWMRAGE
jgi:ataxia telangiectasia mutated family protein